ncbi:MBL fold metallo-hydrolase [Bacteriovorax sp. DB6_IX]|uniref:MBL fold metallo-hydrolase n=1 Tax=Bacteriovorax sp. DB6_IX TaxID=1353530 RepID=UPI00038A2584|nr:MBL fold metallo-hydrolase [Bacteriovorax sp. DB6_IX]EQC51702.1 metallo-beta-lactamase domain protein [Bacteriovorax sp. DB6_IX]
MKLIISICFILLTTKAMSQTAFTIVNTGYADALDILSIEGGEFKKIRFNHAAFIIKHNNKTILFETGIGSKIQDEFDESMPLWAKPAFNFKYVKSLKKQLPNFHYDKILLSHAHWDHAAGLTDGLGTTPTISPEEHLELHPEHIAHHRTFPIHFKDNAPDKFKWTQSPYLHFKKHYDLFGDNKVILVPIPGHSFGSIGLIINGQKEKAFFVGDALWMEKQLDSLAHKACLASAIVDRDKKELSATIRKIKIMRDKYKYKIIPTHDASVHDKFKYFPEWTLMD